jgi:peroxin-12
MLLIDRHFLVTTGGSFTENFYGLKREKTLSSPPLSRTTARVPNQVSQKTKLRTTDVYKSLFMLVSSSGLIVLTAGWRALFEIKTR